MSLLKLQRDVIYGPVYSRRLGKSLGVNLLPTNCKVCPFDCVYCQYGRTDLHISHLDKNTLELPSPAQVGKALEVALSRRPRLDYITLSGNGEPTLHPEFEEMVDEVKKARDACTPDVKLAILSNSCLLSQEYLRKAVLKLDAPIMKLDAGSQEMLQIVNRPCEGITFKEILENLGKLDRLIIQTNVFAGKINNSNAENIEQLTEALKSIKPVLVQVYTVDRPTSEAGLVKLSKQELERVARQIGEDAETRAETYALQCPKCGAQDLSYVYLPSGEQFYQCRCGYGKTLI